MPTPATPRDQTAAAFGSVVRARRLRAELTQEALAERAGLSSKHVARVERGERVPTIHAVLLLAAGLGTTAVELVSEFELAVASSGEAHDKA